MNKKLLDYNDGEEMDIVVMLKDAQLRPSRNGKQYLMLYFSDSSGVIRGNYWNASASDAELFKVGSLVEVNGRREEYQDHPQIRIYSMRLVGPEEGYDMSEFVNSAPIPVSDLKNEINQKVDQIANPNWKRVVKYLLHKFERQFFSFPAGKSNHHAVKNGLAFHTATMLKDAEAIANNYPQVNRELLYAGCILHDMGKVYEMTGPVATKYTAEGNLIGHLVLIDEEIVLAADELNIDAHSEDILLLRHMVISHHGLPEYGAARRPATLEAELLHKIDDLDATVYAITNALQHTVPGEFSEMVRSKDNRRFYRPKHDNNLDNFKKLE
ncbi:3'-5' exoribonuclease YhaM family protein [Lactobacillus colini]|uniref:3'-5' exoribonuclease YhaM family protein n=1 Tax=Lactobacillus colini TaxID=1819254 RepID=UPI001AE7A11A